MADDSPTTTAHNSAAELPPDVAQFRNQLVKRLGPHRARALLRQAAASIPSRAGRPTGSGGHEAENDHVLGLWFGRQLRDPAEKPLAALRAIVTDYLREEKGITSVSGRRAEAAAIAKRLRYHLAQYTTSQASSVAGTFAMHLRAVVAEKAQAAKKST